MTALDLSLLPIPDAVETLSYEQIFAERKAYFLSLFPAAERDEIAATLALESEPITKLLQETAARELRWRSIVNDKVLATTLAFAEGTDLEHRAANFNVKRLTITPADDTTTPPTAAVREDDEPLRERTQNAFEGMSTAGPTKAYEFHARSADGMVADARAFSPSPCNAVVTVLSTSPDGVTPQSLLDKVYAALSDEDVRPVGDRLSVKAALIKSYTIKASLVVPDAGPETELIRAAAMKAAQQYATDRRRIGRSVYRGKLDGVLGVEGTVNVLIHEPAADVICDLSSAALCQQIDIDVVMEKDVLAGGAQP